MIVELGHFALILCFSLSLLQSVIPVVGARQGNAGMMASGTWIAIASFLMLAVSFASLTYAHVASDFSVGNVWENSHSLKPLLYKYSGVWGNHEGSMLLWVLILGFFAALVAAFGVNLPPQLKANVLGVQGWIMTAFLAFIIKTSNPFDRLQPAPFEGKDLNPVLQDIGLAIHPPMLYLGYVGFSITFSFAVAAMLSGRIDAAWARWVRPWALMAWIFLTAGIAMGSYWAYYELGWGGWWFWDPVENASFIPWLTGTALLHSALVMEKREALKIWTLLLALVTFSMSLLGTFLVRSGVLTSVHAFASDPERGVFILAILVVFIGGSLTLFIFRSSELRGGGLFAPVSREGALVFNNLFLATAAASVLTGTLYPLVLESINGSKISVGAPFFNMTFGPLMMPLLLAIPVGPLLSWKRADLWSAIQKLYFAAGSALVIGILALAFVEGTSVLAALGIGAAAWVMIGAFAEIWLRAGFGKVEASTAYRRLKGLPGSTWGTAMAHCGVGLLLLGIVSVSAFQQELIKRVAPGEVNNFAGFEITFEGLTPAKGPNYIEDVARFKVSGRGVIDLEMLPTKRLYTTRKMPTTESAIETFKFSQLYFSLGDPEPDGSITLRAWWKPLVTFIWWGPVLMVLGGLTSLADRRLRVGAPKRAASRRKLVNA
ncbi:MAG: heme lyase NrfEFG subunit NrfE [Hyphomicrobiales bacterium]|nr:MAG: heme lyase NrfEFG subunit NrfE [Hyphomicrobiales bacterium]